MTQGIQYTFEQSSEGSKGKWSIEENASTEAVMHMLDLCCDMLAGRSSDFAALADDIKVMATGYNALGKDQANDSRI